MLMQDGEVTVKCTCTDRCEAGDVDLNCPVCKTNLTECTGTVKEEPESTVVPEEPEEPEPEKSSSAPLLLLLLIAGLGAELLRGEGLEREARVCERHTGTGLTAQQIAEQGLPLPAIDLMPETEEEHVICYADKFYSKSHPERERTVAQTAQSLQKFGEAGVRKFLAWAKKYE